MRGGRSRRAAARAERGGRRARARWRPRAFASRGDRRQHGLQRRGMESEEDALLARGLGVVAGRRDRREAQLQPDQHLGARVAHSDPLEREAAPAQGLEEDGGDAPAADETDRVGMHALSFAACGRFTRLLRGRTVEPDASGQFGASEVMPVDTTSPSTRNSGRHRGPSRARDSVTAWKRAASTGFRYGSNPSTRTPVASSQSRFCSSASDAGSGTTPSTPTSGGGA